MNLPDAMMAMVFEGVGKPLQLKKSAIPVPLSNQVLIKVIACGVCPAPWKEDICVYPRQR